MESGQGSVRVDGDADRLVTETPEQALEHAIREAGGPAAVARYISEHYGTITAQAVCDWKRCPAGRVLQVESACAGKVTRFALRPDLYPPEQPRLAVGL